MIISGDDASVSFLNPMSDFDWVSFADMNESRICMVFKVPPIVIGANVGLKNSPWSNTGEARRWFYRNKLAGMWSMVETSINRQLIPLDQQKFLRFAFDLREVKELQEDEDMLAARLRGLFNDGIIMRSEARERLGLDAGDDGNVYKYGAAVVLVSEGESESMGTGGGIPENSIEDQMTDENGESLFGEEDGAGQVPPVEEETE